MYLYSSLRKPSKLATKKDDKYHLDMAKSYLSSVNTTMHQEFIIRCMVNWCFYKGNQWIFSEDLESFMMDESGSFRNRIKIVQNIVRPIVEYYRGNTIRMDYTPRARAMSRNAINRRESELAEMLTMSNFANKMPPAIQTAFKQKYAIGGNAAETERMFNNKYIDEYEEDINAFQEKISEDNDFEDLKNRLIAPVALDGVGVLKECEWAGKQVWDIQNSWYWFFDHAAQKPDLSDSEFMGDWEAELPVEMFEKYSNLSSTERKMLEEASRDNSPYRSAYNNDYGLHNLFSFSSQLGGRIPKYNVFWKDGFFSEYAFVEDQFGDTIFTKINDKDSIYTDKDIVPPPNEKLLMQVVKSKAWNNSKKSARIFTDSLHYCRFVPAECIGASPDSGYDIILEYGEYPYSKEEGYGAGNVQFPYKCYCWMYDKGEISSPVDAIIDPQRLLNRMLSVGESQINNSRGSGTVLDADMIDAQDGEEEVLKKMNMSQPVLVNAKGNLNNSIGQYDSTVKSGTFALFNVATNVERIAQSMIGGGQALMGGGGAIRATAGVNDANINQGTLMQEPVFYCVNKTLLQAYQSIVSRGKRIAIANQYELVAAVGDAGARVITLSEEYENEIFRVYLERVASKSDQITEGNNLLLMLMNYQLLDGKTIARLFNNANPLEVSKAMREYQAQLEEARAAAKDDATRQAPRLMQGAMAEQRLQDMENDQPQMTEIMKQKIKSDTDLKKTQMNLLGNLARNR